MAHRLISSISRVDRVLNYGLLTGNFSNLAQVQPLYSDFRRILSQSSVYLSLEPRKYDKSVGWKEGKNGGPFKIKQKQSTEKKNKNKTADGASSQSRPKSSPIAPNQDYNSGGNSGGEWDGKENNRGPASRDPLWSNYDRWNIFLSILLCYSIWFNLMSSEKIDWNSYEVIDWKIFVDDYLTQGRVASIKVLNEKWLKVQTAPGASADVAKTVLVKIQSLDSYTNLVAPVFETLKIKSEPKNEPPVGEKKEEESESTLTVKLYFWLRFIYFGRRK